jgi:hypothetical protein
VPGTAPLLGRLANAAANSPHRGPRSSIVSLYASDHEVLFYYTAIKKGMERILYCIL